MVSAFVYEQVDVKPIWHTDTMDISLSSFAILPIWPDQESTYAVARLWQEEEEDVEVAVYRAVVEQPSCLARLAGLANSPDIADRFSAAKHTDCPESLLRVLARDELPTVRGAVARNPNTPQAVLAQLSLDVRPEVRMAVAHNRQSSPQTLERLGRDPHWAVRTAVINNSACPLLILEHLLEI
jgi:hypothetical protein